MKKDNKFVITKSNDCPIFNRIDDSKLVLYIENKFLPIAKEIALISPELVTDYNRNLKILYTFDLYDEENN